MNESAVLPVPIYTPRLILKPPQPNDASLLNALIIESFPELQPWMPWTKEKPAVQQTEKFIAESEISWRTKGNDLPLLLFERNSGMVMGGTGFHRIQWDIPRLEIGYWQGTKFKGKGFMTEAVHGLTQYAIKILNAKRIEIRCDKDNLASKKIPERLGYHLEARLKNDRINFHGQLSDTLIFVRFDLNELPHLEIKC